MVEHAGEIAEELVVDTRTLHVWALDLARAAQRVSRCRTDS
jgi:hypothetical protein